MLLLLILFQDSEVMRLKLRLCSTDRCGDNCSSNNRCSNNSNIPDHEYSHPDSYGQDNVDSPVPLLLSQHQNGRFNLAPNKQ